MVPIVVTYIGISGSTFFNNTLLQVPPAKQSFENQAGYRFISILGSSRFVLSAKCFMLSQTKSHCVYDEDNMTFRKSFWTWGVSMFSYENFHRHFFAKTGPLSVCHKKLPRFLYSQLNHFYVLTIIESYLWFYMLYNRVMAYWKNILFISFQAFVKCCNCRYDKSSRAASKCMSLLPII